MNALQQTQKKKLRTVTINMISMMQKMRTESRNPVIRCGIYSITQNVTAFGKFWMNKSEAGLYNQSKELVSANIKVQ